MVLFWGSDFYQFFNSAFFSVIGPELQRAAPGSPAQKGIPLLWQLIEEDCKSVFATGKKKEYEDHQFALKRKEGEEESHFKCFFSALLEGDGRIGGVLVNCVEITQQIKKQKMLTQKLAELRLDNENREQFVSLLTHDLRNPLTAAKISAQAIERSNMPKEKLARFLSRIISNLNRAELMIENMLDANRIKAGEKLNLKLVDFEMVHFIQDILVDLSMVHGPRFHFKHDEDKVEGCWSQDGVRRIIENLCNNAIKFGKSDTPVTVSLMKADEHIEIAVHNLGNAIAEKDQKFLFDPHHRRLLDNTNGSKGWGLGLTLVKGITDAHGGRTELTSNSAEGTTFKIFLPN